MIPVRRAARVLNARYRPAQSGHATLAFSNSLGTDLRVWDKVAALLPDTLGLLRYDTAGHGLSALEHPMSIADHGADLIGLFDAFAIETAVIVGLSVGGLIAQQVAISAPTRVAGLVLSNTAAKIGTPEIWSARLADIKAGGMKAVADATMERWFSESFRTEHPDAVALWRTMLLHTPAGGYMDLARAIQDCDLSASIPAITVPTLCLAGGADASTPPEVVRALAAAIPAAIYREFPGVGHLPPVECPDAVVPAILELVAEVAQ